MTEIRPPRPRPPRPVDPQITPLANLTQSDHTRWIAWRYTWKPGTGGKPGKWDKPPYQTDGTPARNNDPETWYTYSEVWPQVLAGKFDGIGLMLSGLPGEELAMLDLDDVRDPATGALVPWADALVAEANTFTEITPSQRGLRIVGRAPGMGPIHRRKDKHPQGVGGFEIYIDAERYVTVSGHQLAGTPKVRNDISHVIHKLMALMGANGQDRSPGTGAPPPPNGAGHVIDLQDLSPLVAEMISKGTFNGAELTDRSRQFFRCVQYLRKKFSFDDVLATLEAYSEGLQAKYQGRISEELTRVWGKTRADEIEHELPVVPWIYQTTSNWEGRAIPDMQWVWPGWIPRQQATGLYGVGGIRKTSLLIQLAVAVATGTSFLGVQMEKMPVCALFCEDVENEVIRKIDTAATHYKLSRRDLAGLHWAALVGYDDPELMTFDRGKGTQTDSLKRLDKWILETGAGLVILDTAAHFFGGEEVNRREVTRFIRQLDAISMIRNCGIVLSRHPSARGRGPGGRMESGSTGWEGSFRSRIALRHPETDDEEEAGRSNERVIELMKSNYAMPGALINCTCEGGVFTLAKVQPGGGVMANSKVGKEACKQRFRELLKKLYDQGRFVSFSKSAAHRYAPTVFAQECGPLSGGYSAIQYAKAMLALLDEKAIVIEVFGRKSDGKQRLTLTTQVKPPSPADDKSMG